MTSLVSRAVACALASVAFVSFANTRARADGSMADVDAAARSEGNRPALARGIGDAIFATNWPAQILKVRVEAVGKHAVAGLMLSGVKFHSPTDRAAFLGEVSHLVALSFAHSPVEEVDVWAIVPLATHPHEVVAGDLAMPTSRTVFAVSTKRGEGGAFDGRLQNGHDVFWDAGWERTLGGR